ncbi:MAG: hypothetical protein WB919_23215 [Candidatus Sulfotelmatobacter sp.]
MARGNDRLATKAARDTEGARLNEAKVPAEVKSGRGTGEVVTGTLVLLSALALPAYVVMAMKTATPIEVAGVITASSGPLAAVGAAFRAWRGR